MAQLKDLIVNGASRLIGDAFANKLQITTLADSANSIGTDGQVLKSDGSKIVWGSDSNAGGTVTQTIAADNNYYRVLFSASASDTTLTEGTKKDTDFRWNPSTNTLDLGGTNGNATLASTHNSLTVSSASALYFNRPNESSIIFQHGGTNKIRIDNTADSLRPETHNTLSVGNATIGWKEMFISSQDGAMNNGLQFTNGTDITGRVGSNSTGKIGIYGSTDVIIRPSLTSSGVGIVLNGTSVVPGANNNHTLGSSSLKWNNVYSRSFNNLITGTGTAAKDNGSGSSNRYMPAKWTFNTGSNTVDGDIYTIKIPVAGHSYGVFMSVNNGTNYYPIVADGLTGRLTTHYVAGMYIQVVFDAAGSATSIYPLAGGTSTTTVTGGVFRVINYYNTNSDTYTSAYCGTAAGTVAKAATCTYWTATPKSYIHINFRYANTAANPTLNIASTGAKPIYVNGVRATGSVLPAGSYIAYYDGTNYQFRTDGFLPGEGSKQLKFLNTTVPTSAWVNDTTYSQYPKKADITCTGVTGNMYGDVIFNVTEAVSGNFAPIAATGNNKVTIWAQDTPTTDIVIPTIVIF